MKTEELIQLLALAGIGYIAYQKFGKPKDTSTPNTTTPGQQFPLDPNFGLNNPGDATWSDGGTGFWASLWEGL